jgi:hypothetical protein
MSIEQQLDDINTNLREIVALLAGKQPEKATEKVAAPKAAAKPAPPKAEAPKPAAAPEAPVDISNETMSKVVLDLLQKRGKDTAVKLLASFGAAKATAVPEADRPKFLADAKTLMAAA